MGRKKDEKQIFEMITFEKALTHILQNTPTLPVTKVPIEESIGRILQENVYSKIEMPPFHKSAMDGYAVIAEDTKGAPLRFKCIGLIQAGETFRKKMKHGECVKIMTGAPLPRDADSVVMIENIRRTHRYV
ncbi:MAG TPA: molybdopterin molybdenumtransferase MoeA, partial [Candidatus Omnitrophica bacterium]|nr:molybdopterin molybdenumtransferase MoeA [Candidatus Omnitrophota bacterium]